jgi:ERCC4-type nuclease
MTLVIDTREIKPYTFDDLPSSSRPNIVRSALPTGDYSLLGHEFSFAIERKSPADAYSTFSRDRDRFIRELDRARSFDFFAILIESSVRDLLTPPPHVERVRPATVINSLLSWSIEYGVHVFFACDREIGRTIVLRLAERFWRHKHDPKPKHDPNKRPKTARLEAAEVEEER